jgi:PAP2 superfamily
VPATLKRLVDQTDDRERGLMRQPLNTARIDDVLEVSQLSGRGLRDAAGNLFRVAILAAALFTLVLARMDVPVYVLIGAVAGALVALYLADARRGRWLLLGGYLVGFVFFALLRTMADETGITIKASYVVEADKWLFGGTLPTEWLQQRLYEAHAVGALEISCAVVYVSYYFVPHLVALVLWQRDPAAFRRYGLAVILTVYSGLAVSYAVPTAPPWLADRSSRVPHMSRVLADALGWNPEHAGNAGTSGANPYAAMPSLHLALTALVVLGLWRHRILRLPALVYAGAMAFTLVYAGEHYVVDELAGVATAGVAWPATAWLARSRAAGDRRPGPRHPRRWAAARARE